MVLSSWFVFQVQILCTAYWVVTFGLSQQATATVGPLTFFDKVVRYKLLKGAKLIPPSIPNMSKEQYLEYLKIGTLDDAQNDFLSVEPIDVEFNKVYQTLDGKVGDHIWLVLSKYGRYQVPTLTIHTNIMNREGRPTYATEVINYALEVAYE